RGRGGGEADVLHRDGEDEAVAGERRRRWVGDRGHREVGPRRCERRRPPWNQESKTYAETHHQSRKRSGSTWHWLPPGVGVVQGPRATKIESRGIVCLAASTPQGRCQPEGARDSVGRFVEALRRADASSGNLSGSGCSRGSPGAPVGSSGADREHEP